MAQNIGDDTNFGTLSLRDLIEARDQYHSHLMSKANVVGTAIGLYLIRTDEAWPDQVGDGIKPKKKLTYPRRFDNSEVRDYSWPSVIVLVRDWVREADFGGKNGVSPWDAVPKRLYLPDGRAVPVCVVEAPPLAQNKMAPPAPRMLPNAVFGGGLPVQVEVQHQAHLATLGCLVTDGHTLYALTARHVCGEPGTIIQADMRGGLRPIGVSTPHQLTRKLFSEVYPALPMRQTWLGLDAGLVRINDARDWTSNVYGLPPLKPIFDLYEQNISLRRLIDKPVLGVGATSGLVEGRIKALFYRYRSVGGYDYVSDFLISPRKGKPGARHGDSGMIWHLQMPSKAGKEDRRPLLQRDLRPIAVEWGAQVFAERGERSTYSVATSLSNVCKLLDVELVIDHNDGVSGTWGAVGHYTIGSLAIDLVRDPVLKGFLQANADLMSIPTDNLGTKPNEVTLRAGAMVPLADVPDIVWKKPAPSSNSSGIKGGRDRGSKIPEHATHHADADHPFDGKPTVLKACRAKPALLSAAKWNEYYESFPEPPNEFHKGILPFRIQQFFERMKDYAATDPDAFITAAGILAHYVGDACQPLHGTYMHDGIPDEQPDFPRTVTDRRGNKHPAVRGEGVHSAYETAMINWSAHNGKLFAEIDKFLDPQHLPPLVSTGPTAAMAIVELMDAVATVLPPRTIIDAFEKTQHPDASNDSATLWNDLGEETGKVMALGVRTLAMLWDAAWSAGHGSVDGGKRKPADLRALYENENFLRSVTIKDIDHEIANPTPL